MSSTRLPPHLNPEQRIPLPMVLDLTGLGKTKVYDLIAKGEFPEPDRLSSRCVRWRAGDVVAWLDARRASATASNTAAAAVTEALDSARSPSVQEVLATFLATNGPDALRSILLNHQGAQ